MTFTELFAQSALFWPEVIDIRDGKLIGSQGGLFPGLSMAWDEAEREAYLVSELHGLMSWAIYGALHARARTLLSQSSFSLRLSDCDPSEIKRRFEENLFSPTAEFEGLQGSYKSGQGQPAP